MTIWRVESMSQRKMDLSNSKNLVCNLFLVRKLNKSMIKQHYSIWLSNSSNHPLVLRCLMGSTVMTQNANISISVFCNMYVHLSQNWGSDGHFEVLNRSYLSLVQKLWHKMQIFPFNFFLRFCTKTDIWVFWIFGVFVFFVINTN